MIRLEENQKLKVGLKKAEADKASADEDGLEAMAKEDLAKTKIANLEMDKVNYEARLKALVTNQPIGTSERLEIAMDSLVPRITLLFASYDRIQSLSDPTGAYGLLAEVDRGKTTKGKKVQGATGFKELRFKTGIPGDDGRFYYRPKDGKVQVLVSVKEDQDRDIRRLGRLET